MLVTAPGEKCLDGTEALLLFFSLLFFFSSFFLSFSFFLELRELRDF